MLAKSGITVVGDPAEISAAVMRRRLTGIAEPARGVDASHGAAEEIAKQFEEPGAEVVHLSSARTDPMTVVEVIALRHDNPRDAKAVLQSFPAFVALARRHEWETWTPCTVVVSCRA